VLWPLPGTLLLMKRYKVAAAMLKQHLSVRNRNDSTDTLAT
jgi:hypothetical protein